MNTTNEIKVGDVVWFKADVEQCGVVLAIREGSRDKEFKVDVKAGEYRGVQWIPANRCWTE